MARFLQVRQGKLSRRVGNRPMVGLQKIWLGIGDFRFGLSCDPI